MPCPELEPRCDRFHRVVQPAPHIVLVHLVAKQRLSRVGQPLLGTVVPGYKDYANPTRFISRYRNDEPDGTLRAGLSSIYSVRSDFTILEGYTNWEEDAGFYRSHAWAGYPNKFLNVVREYSDRRTQTLRFQAEACDEFNSGTAGGSSGSPFRQDGLNTVTLATGEWAVRSSQPGGYLQFNDVLLSHGRYRFSARASANGGGKAIRFVVGGTPGPWVTVPIGGMDTIGLGELFLPIAGYDLRIEFSDAGIDLDWFFSKKIDQRAGFRTWAGYYLVADLGGGGIMAANRLGIGDWETVNLIDENGGALMNGDTVVFQSFNGHYLAAEGGGGSNVNFNRTGVGSWERFTIVKVSGSPGSSIVNGDQVGFRSSDGIHYLVAENGGNSAVNCNRTGIGTWEQFTIIFR